MHLQVGEREGNVSVGVEGGWTGGARKLAGHVQLRKKVKKKVTSWMNDCDVSGHWNFRACRRTPFPWRGERMHVADGLSLNRSPVAHVCLLVRCLAIIPSRRASRDDVVPSLHPMSTFFWTLTFAATRGNSFRISPGRRRRFTFGRRNCRGVKTGGWSKWRAPRHRDAYQSS